MNLSDIDKVKDLIEKLEALKTIHDEQYNIFTRLDELDVGFESVDLMASINNAITEVEGEIKRI